MAFTGGPINLLGVVPSYTSNLGQQTSASGTVQAQNQIWQGVGKSFVGQPGQPLTGSLTGSPINVALNSDSVQNVLGPGGGALTSGSNIKAPAMTKFLSGTQAFSFNDQIGSSLSAAGPFGSLMSRGGSSSLGALTSLASGFGGGGGASGSLVGSPNYIMFPGAGEESASNYAGVPYSLQDVTFSLQPANKGPQSSGSAQATSNPTSGTTLAATDYTSMPPNAQSLAVNDLKKASISPGNFSQADKWLTNPTFSTR